MSTQQQQLALSAAVFTAGVDSWIPQSWGSRSSEADDKAVFEHKLRQAAVNAEDSKLGVGHPDIGVYKPKAHHLSTLEKRLGKVDKGAKAKGDGQDAGGPSGSHLGQIQGNGAAGDSDDEGESRSRSISTKKVKKNAFPDLLGGKKKKAKQVQAINAPPLLNLAPLPDPPSVIKGASTEARASKSDETAAISTHTSPSSATKAPPAHSPSTPVVVEAATSTKRARDDSPVSPHSQDVLAHVQDSTHDGKMSKTQRRREARKRARLARESLS